MVEPVEICIVRDRFFLIKFLKKKKRKRNFIFSFETNWFIFWDRAAIYANRHYLNLYRETHPDRLAKLDSAAGPTVIGDVFIHPTAQVHPSATVILINCPVVENLMFSYLSLTFHPDWSQR